MIPKEKYNISWLKGLIAFTFLLFVLVALNKGDEYKSNIYDLPVFEITKSNRSADLISYSLPGIENNRIITDIDFLNERNRSFQFYTNNKQHIHYSLFSRRFLNIKRVLNKTFTAIEHITGKYPEEPAIS